MDDAGLRELYVATQPRLVRALTLAAGSAEEAEEAVQDAFVQALRHWGTVQHLADPEAWVRGVAFRRLSNRRRKARNGAAALLRRGRQPDAAPPDPLRVDVERALAQLPLAQRTVVVLHHLVGLDLAQIAEELRVPVGTVKSRLNRGRAALAPLLREENARA